MGKGIKVSFFKNKKNGQFVLSIPKKKLSKSILLDMDNSKQMKISIEKLYPNK